MNTYPNTVPMLQVLQLRKSYDYIYIRLLRLLSSPPFNLLVSCSMNGLAFVLVQTAAVEDKLNQVKVGQLYAMAYIRLLWMSVNLP